MRRRPAPVARLQRAAAAVLDLGPLLGGLLAVWSVTLPLGAWAVAV